MRTRVGEVSFEHGLPDAAARRKLRDDPDFERAVRGGLRAEPAVDNPLCLRALVPAGWKLGDIEAI